MGSLITSEDSTSLAENVEGFQQRVKEILKLIEQGDFSDLTAEIYDHKKSELTTQVSELSRMHKLLAAQHDHFIGEFSKNCPSLIKKQQLDYSNSRSPQVSQMLTPDQSSNNHKFRTPLGFDLLLSSGSGGFIIRGSDSTVSLSSDSDSESFISTNKLLMSPLNDDLFKVKETKGSEELLKKITDLEEALVSLNTKFQTLADENTKLKLEIHEKESDMQLAQDEIRTQKSNLEAEKAKVADLQHVIGDSDYKIETLEEELDASKEKLVTAKADITKLTNELSSKINKETQWLQGQLDSSQQELALLHRHIDSEREKLVVLREKLSLFAAEISLRNDQITKLNTNINQFKSEISRLRKEKSQSVDELNGLKLKHDSQESLISELEKRLNAVQVEHVGIIASFDIAQQAVQRRVLELEKEISERGEEKREAIRQLSFSLEHYMSGYKQLRQTFVKSS